MDELVKSLEEQGLSHDKAASMVRIVIREVGRLVSDPQQRRKLVEALPEPMGGFLVEGDASGGDLEELYLRVEVEAHQTPGRARELTQLVCAEIGRRADARVRELLRASLPGPVADLFPRRQLAGAAPHVHPGSSLATARPGSRRRPLSESAPAKAHSGSVASANPHADDKLSSGHASSGAPIAEERAGSEHPLAEEKP